METVDEGDPKLAPSQPQLQQPQQRHQVGKRSIPEKPRPCFGIDVMVVNLHRAGQRMASQVLLPVEQGDIMTMLQEPGGRHP